jgi:hypothetical protein
MPRKKTQEEFVNEIYNLTKGEYEVVSKYISAIEKVKFLHKPCNTILEVVASHFVSNNYRCRQCKKRKPRKTHRQFVEEVIEIRGDIYEFLSEYTSSTDLVKIKHKACGHVWNVTPTNLTKKDHKGKLYCPNCNGGVGYTLEKFKEKVFSLVKEEYVVIGDYVNAQTPIKMKHNLESCSNVYHVRPNDFISGENRCPKCYGSTKRTTEEFKDIVHELEGNDYIVNSEYINTNTPISISHNVENCNYTYSVTPTHFFRGQRCPMCKSSKGELKIAKFLDCRKIKYKIQYQFNELTGIGGNSLRFDFAIFNPNNQLKYLIEYDGEFHFEKLYEDDGHETLVEHDKRKNNYCKENGIKLYRIPYWEFDNIELILSKLIHTEEVKVDENFLVIL